MMFPEEIHSLSQKIIQTYQHANKMLVTAESCTGGLIAGALTDIPGSSSVIERGFVSYSNNSKIEVLGVQPEVLEEYGAVSAETATQMAQGALEFSRADIALSVTGIAGPGGGSADKPVGLVYFGIATREGALVHYKCQFTGDRNSVRLQAVTDGLKLILMLAETDASS